MRRLERSVIIVCRANGLFWGPFPGRKRVWETERRLATRYFFEEAADAALGVARTDSPKHAHDIVLEYWGRSVKLQAAD